MSQRPLVSSKRLIAELIADYNIQGTDWLTSIHRHISRGMELMRLDGYFIRKAVKANVVNLSAKLPCDNKYLIGAVILTDNGMYRIPLKCNFALTGFLAKLAVHPNIQARTEGEYLITNVDNITIGFIYYGLPLDEEENPMIIDNAFVLEALPYFIIEKLSLSGYVHPVISREEAKAEWKEKSRIATHDVNFPSLEEMESFTQANTNPYHVYILGQELLGINN